MQWAWDNGLLREYSAWAVALDAADAWERAIRASNIPEPQVALSGPLLVHSLAYSMASTSTQPSSTGRAAGSVGSAAVAGEEAAVAAPARGEASAATQGLETGADGHRIRR